MSPQRTRLHQIAQSRGRNAEAIAEMLLTQHEDVRATDKDGWTPLHFVSYTGAVGIVKLLVKKGADVAARHEGERPR